MYQVVLVTFPDKAAAIEVAKILISEKLAACINILPEMQAVYSWKDELRVDDEVQMVIKTLTTKFNELSDRITQLHSYDVAEIIALDIKAGNSPYLQWISESLDS
tara:strand:+ start:191 stop:505 length:315 start_codon:yes stop_codon:yes gene_type:complete